jgi:flagellar motor switch protein FliG
MADSLREAMGENGPVAPRAGEEAMAAVVAAIRRLEEEGALTLLAPDAIEGAAPVDAPRPTGA